MATGTQPGRRIRSNRTAASRRGCGTPRNAAGRAAYGERAAQGRTLVEATALGVLWCDGISSAAYVTEFISSNGGPSRLAAFTLVFR